jgi:hypothetical protein
MKANYDYRVEATEDGRYWIVVGPELPLGPEQSRLTALYENMEEAEHVARRMNYARKVALWGRK